MEVLVIVFLVEFRLFELYIKLLFVKKGVIRFRIFNLKL